MAAGGNRFRQSRGLGGTIVLCVLLSVVLVCALLLYAGALRGVFQNEIIDALGEVSRQNAAVIHSEVAGKFELLTEIARWVHGVPEDTGGVLLRVEGLEDPARRYGFRRMGLIRPDGTAYGTDGAVMDLSGRDYFSRAMVGENAVSASLTDVIVGDGINVYAVPVLREGRVEGVLFATYSNETFRRRLSSSLFQGRGYTYIVDRQGGAVMASVHPESVASFQNIYDSLAETAPGSGEAAEELRALIQGGGSGYVRFTSTEEKYMYCCPIEGTEWSLLMVVPLSAANRKMNLVAEMTTMFGVLLLLVFLVLVVHILRSHARQKRALMKLAYVDPVTGGASFARFRIAAEERLGQSHPPADLLALDLESFKSFNDLFGYGEGNGLLRYVSQALGELAGEADLCARRGSDHFAALCFCRDREELERRLERFYARLRGFTVQGDTPFTVVPAVGVYRVGPGERGSELDFMLDCADMARKTVKGNRSRLCAYYDGTFRDRLLREKELEDRMEEALEKGEFEAFYQPKYAARDGAVTGAEALVRWRQPDGSLVLPGAFVPLAERNGFVTALDRWMFREVCRQQSRWLREGLPVVPVSVNLSRRHLYHPDFVKSYLEILEESGLPHSLVQLEITESAAFDSTEIIQQVTGAFRREGIAVLMDDFGSGYSSMAMFKNISIDVLKLDKCFVDDIGDEKGEKILATMIGLAHALGVGVTAEGVETEAQFRFLRDQGCDDIQGYYFARPMPAGEYTQKLLRGRKETPP